MNLRKLAAVTLLSAATVPAFAATLDPSDGQAGGAFWGNANAISSLTRNTAAEQFTGTAQAKGNYDFLDRYNP